MKIYVFHGGPSDACIDVIRTLGHTVVDEIVGSDLAIAPLLKRRLPRDEYLAPRLGTLVFHPSALPYRRGPDAIRHAINAGERVSAVTWFWCSDGWDTGDICDQAVVVLHPGESPGRAYHTRFVPAGLRSLTRLLIDIEAGRVRREPQDESLATYDRAIG